MIRINLLPQSARRRRRRGPGRELAIAVLVLVSAALITAGALWIAGTEAESEALRRETEELTRATKAVRAALDPATLVPRERALQADWEVPRQAPMDPAAEDVGRWARVQAPMDPAAEDVCRWALGLMASIVCKQDACVASGVCVCVCVCV